MRNYVNHHNSGTTEADYQVAKDLVRQTPSKLFPITMVLDDSKGFSVDPIYIVTVDSGNLDFASAFTQQTGGVSSLNIIAKEGFKVNGSWLLNNVIRVARSDAEAQLPNGGVGSGFQTIFTNQNPIIKSFESSSKSPVECRKRNEE